MELKGLWKPLFILNTNKQKSRLITFMGSVELLDLHTPTNQNRRSASLFQSGG